MSKYDITKSWLGGDSFIKRAFAVWGYCLAAIGMFYVALFSVALVLGIVFTMADAII